MQESVENWSKTTLLLKLLPYFQQKKEESSEHAQALETIQQWISDKDFSVDWQSNEFDHVVAHTSMWVAQVYKSTLWIFSHDSSSNKGVWNSPHKVYFH